MGDQGEPVSIPAERRILLLQTLATELAGCRNVREVCDKAVQALAHIPAKRPYALLYLMEGQGPTLTLQAAHGLEAGHPAAPKSVSAEDGSLWPFPSVFAAGQAQMVATPGVGEGGDGRAVMFPLTLAFGSYPRGMVIVGMVVKGPIVPGLEDFLSLVSNQVTASLVNAKAREDTERLAEETRLLETLHNVGIALSSDLDLERVVQTATDAATGVSGAEFGAFFYNVINAEGESYTLYTISGVPREAFSKFPMPRNTQVFEPTFRGDGVVRSDNIKEDPRYGHSAPYYGQPAGHLPVVSYLAVPVISRSGEVIGGMFFGHKNEGVFSERSEKLVTGIASQAAIAIDNARLFRSAQIEIEQRRRIEQHQKSLLDELNHRVKNTLATVQAIASQTLRGTEAVARDSFLARLFALSSQHDLLTQENWEGSSLTNIILRTLAPYREEGRERFTVEGPFVHLDPKRGLALGMAFHELATNAARHGAFSVPDGRVHVNWTIEDGILALVWREEGGPRVSPPARRGFGTRLIERGLAREVSGQVRLDFAPEGIVCEWKMPVLQS